MLTIRVHDAKHNQDFSDRFNIRLQIRPGLNEIEIMLSQVVRGPSDREPDLENVAGIGLFVQKQDDFDRLEIERIFLE